MSHLLFAFHLVLLEASSCFVIFCCGFFFFLFEVSRIFQLSVCVSRADGYDVINRLYPPGSRSVTLLDLGVNSFCLHCCLIGFCNVLESW